MTANVRQESYLVEPGKFIEWREGAGRKSLAKIQKRIGVTFKYQFQGRPCDKELTT